MEHKKLPINCLNSSWFLSPLPLSLSLSLSRIASSMGDHSRSHSHDLLHIFGFGSLCRACKSFVSKCYPDKHSLFFKKTGNKIKPKPIEEDTKISRLKNHKPVKRNPDEDDTTTGSPQWSPLVSTREGPSPLSRSTSHDCSPFMRSNSKKEQTQTRPTKGPLLRSTSHKDGSSAASASMLSRSASRTGTTHILYSNSNGLVKPAAMEKQLGCTLEELCFGCIKKVEITRDAVTENGQIVEEDEILTIKVQPGWRKGTRITFEGKGNEMPGTEPADVIFIVAEKQHPIFSRRDDDLELGLEVPLVDALTGCSLSVPLLGSQTTLVIDEIGHPGYEKIIKRQGMPKLNDPGTRGDLIITLSVKFPEDLTEEQRSTAANILKESC